jgi:alginate O-acetyltransferase complex protein AlgI|tara:strand:- start:1144 stop:2595 length:1452 start_codon:yes stop_codon:yes gene_type:complete
MLFNSLDFAIFLPIVFLLYWFVVQKNLKLQNALIVVASYVFYGWWDWRFLSLIIFSTVVDYLIGQKLRTEEKQSKRKVLLWTSIIVNLGFLGFFKYYNFFLENFVDVFSLFGMQINANSLNIILPIGISFYTFQTLSYTIDVYKKKLEPTKDFMAFSAFVCFFPQLVAGPIERATNLLPQFYKKRTFEYHKAVDGMRQILWGLFKKLVIADNCANFANQIFNNSADMNGSTLVLGAIFFTFQIYADFSGYSDIAIGTSRLFGFDLKQNFATPYFSRDIAEFWRRWHISLSTWFRDYLYIPLGGSRGGTWMKVRNTFAIFLVSGFWHGANWTFIIWGTLNAIYFLPLLLTNNNRKNLGVVAEGKLFPSFRELFAMLTTFMLTVFAWIFFRSEDLNHAFSYIGGIFSKNILSIPSFEGRMDALITMVLISIFLLIEWLGRNGKYGIEQTLISNNIYIRVFIYFLLVNMILLYTKNGSQAFIYFQF